MYLCSYCSLRVNVSQLESLFKCIFKGFTDNWCPRKHLFRISPSRILAKIENFCSDWFHFTAIFAIIRSDVVEGIQSVEAYNSFKAVLQSKASKRSHCMSSVCIGKNLKRETKYQYRDLPSNQILTL